MSVYQYLHDFITYSDEQPKPEGVPLFFYPVLQTCTKKFFESQITKKLLSKNINKYKFTLKERCKHLNLTLESDTFRFITKFDLEKIKDEFLVSKVIDKAEFILELGIDLDFFKTFNNDPGNFSKFIKKNIITLNIRGYSKTPVDAYEIYLNHLMRVLNKTNTIEKLSVDGCYLKHRNSLILEKNKSVKRLSINSLRFLTNNDFLFIDIGKFTNLIELYVYTPRDQVSIVLPTENHYLQSLTVPISRTNIVDNNNDIDTNFFTKFSYLSCLRHFSGIRHGNISDGNINNVSEFFINNVIDNEGYLKISTSNDKWDYFKKGDKLKKLEMIFIDRNNFQPKRLEEKTITFPECEHMLLQEYKGTINFYPSLRSLELCGGSFTFCFSSPEIKKSYYDGFKQLVNLEKFTLKHSNLSISSVINAEFIACLSKTVKTISLLLSNTHGTKLDETEPVANFDYYKISKRIEIIDAPLLFFTLNIRTGFDILELHLKGELKTPIKIEGYFSRLTCEKEYFRNNDSRIERFQRKCVMTMEDTFSQLLFHLFNMSIIQTFSDPFDINMNESLKIYDMFKYDDNKLLKFKSEFYEIRGYTFLLDLRFMMPEFEYNILRKKSKFIFANCIFGGKPVLDGLKNYMLFNSA